MLKSFVVYIVFYRSHAVALASSCHSYKGSKALRRYSSKVLNSFTF